MTSPDNPRKELHSTYFVQDRNNEEEMTRLTLQDQMMTKGMGGVLAEQSDPTLFHRVLDVGCGTGGWLIEVARTYPTIELLIGADISVKMVHYARTQVESDPTLVGRVEFAVMDALRMLEFQDGFFDLVNARLAMSYLRTWDWRPYLDECKRVCRPGGMIRFTEGTIGKSNSPALTQLNSFLFNAFNQAGHYFTNDHRGLIDELPHLFKRHGLQDIQTREHILHYLPGTEQGELFKQDMAHIFRTLRPFLKKWTQVPDNYDEIYQQALREMQQPDFEATGTLLTIWGTIPRRNDDPQFLIVP